MGGLSFTWMSAITSQYIQNLWSPRVAFTRHIILKSKVHWDGRVFLLSIHTCKGMHPLCFSVINPIFLTKSYVLCNPFKNISRCSLFLFVSKLIPGHDLCYLVVTEWEGSSDLSSIKRLLSGSSWRVASLVYTLRWWLLGFMSLIVSTSIVQDCEVFHRDWASESVITSRFQV